MSKICENCGKTLDDATRFCDNCGTAQNAAPQETPVQESQPTPAAPKKVNFDFNKIIDEVKQFANGLVNRCKADKKFMYTSIAVAAAAVVVLVLLLALVFGGNSYTSALDNYINATFNGKANAVKKMAPAEYWEYYEEENDEDFDDFLDDYKDSIEDRIEYLEDEYGKNYKVTYKIEDKKELSDKKLKGIAEALADKYDMDEDKVTAGWELEVELTIKGSEDDDDSEQKLTVIKYKGNWYMISWSKSGDNYRASFFID